MGSWEIITDEVTVVLEGLVEFTNNLQWSVVLGQSKHCLEHSMGLGTRLSPK